MIYAETSQVFKPCEVWFYFIYLGLLLT